MQPIEFLPCVANSLDYPKPRFTFLPQLDTANWLRTEEEMPEGGFVAHGQLYMYGRYALVDALQRAGVGRDTVVLLPAYHCRTIVDAVLYLEAQPLFYPVRDTLEPDFEYLTTLTATVVVQAMLLTHYFGFANLPVETEAFCRNRGIKLIEDCAHAYYGSSNGRALGSFGQYAIASAWKFFPVRYGAILRDNTGKMEKRLTHQPFLKELKSIAGLAITHSRNSPPTSRLDLDALYERAQALGKRELQHTGLRHDPDSFRPEWVHLAAPRVYTWLVEKASHGHIANKRRSNYQLWLKGLQNVKGIKPLFPQLHEGMVPYAFPLLADSDGLIFHALKLASIPIWRWEDMASNAISNCPVVDDYRLRLLQLPCHQGLNASDIAWMTSVVAHVAQKFSFTDE